MKSAVAEGGEGPAVGDGGQFLLALETATARGSVAWLSSDAEVLALVELPGQRDHGACLAPAVASMLGAELSRLGAYAVAIGPGSFTGLRIALSFVKGVAVFQPRPVVAVSTLELLAHKAATKVEAKRPILALMDARNDEVYAGLYRLSEDLAVPDVEPSGLPEGLYTSEALRSRLRTCGPLTVALEDPAWLPGQGAERVVVTPDAATLGRLAVARWRAGRVTDVPSLEPRYLQASAAERKRDANALR